MTLHQRIQEAEAPSRIERSPLTGEIVERRDSPGSWGVEAIDDDGGVLMAIFSGPESRARAIEYAHAKFRTVNIL